MASEIEQSISAIPKVKSCRVVLGADEEVDQIFVWADIGAPDADEKEKLRQIKSLVRSVVGTVALKHNYDLDYRKVKILEYAESGLVQGREPEGQSQSAGLPGYAGAGAADEVAPASEVQAGAVPLDAPRRSLPRIKLVAAYVRYLAEPEVVVELGFLGDTFIGRAPVEDGLAQASFAAFKEAFEAVGLGKVRSIYIAEMVPSLSQPKIVLSKLQLTLPNNERAELLGAVEDRGDSVVSVVKASLDALNRKITRAN